jgi:malonyl CoA-acyl carrier protein transacylase
MLAAGVLDADEVESFNRTLLPGSLAISDAVFLVASCDIERAIEAIAALPDVVISHDNCPHQVIICGSRDSIERTAARLRARAVSTASLPFGSGMHTRFFKDRIASHDAAVARLRFRPPAKPLYSATTCAPFPDNPPEIARLTIAHMVERVRFREMILRMHQEGVRVFVQAGCGSLVGFIEDTLRGLPHLAISTAISARTGLAQLQHVACALWTEGAQIDFAALVHGDSTVAAKRARPIALSLGVPLVRFQARLHQSPAKTDLTSPARSVGSDPIRAAFEQNLQHLRDSQHRVLEAYERPGATVPRVDDSSRLELSLARYPELIDHSFFSQRRNWPSIADHNPVVPMTGLIELMRRAASAAAPSRRIIGFDNIHARRWLEVAEAVSLTVRCRFVDPNRARIELGDYAGGDAVFDGTLDELPALSLTNERPAPISAAELYSQRWVFHGPEYHGVARLGPTADDGIRGEIVTGSALGAALDNAGQLFGYWVASQTPRSLAMPIRIAKLRYHGTDPAVGDRLECTVAVRSLAADHAVADMILETPRGPWLAVSGWEDRRIVADERLWTVITRPEQNLLSSSLVPGIVVLSESYRTALVQQYLRGRYLIQAERVALARHALSEQWALLGRCVVARDAARSRLWSDEQVARFPAEVELDGLPPSSATVASRHLHIATCSGAGFIVGVAHDRPTAVAVMSVAGHHEYDRAAEAFRCDDESIDELNVRIAAARAASRPLTSKTDHAAAEVIDRRGGTFLIGRDWVTTLRHQDVIVAWTSS